MAFFSSAITILQTLVVAIGAGLQAFLMMVCVGIYSVLVAAVPVSDNIMTSLLGVAGYTVLLCFTLLKTSSLSKAIFNAH